MRTETENTNEFTSYIRGMPRPWTVIKHCDRLTKGIPDLSVSNTNNHTLWIEAKRIEKLNHTIRNVKHWVAKDEVLQLNTLARLNGFYLVYDDIHSQTGFIRATTAYRHYRQDLVIEVLMEPEFLLSGERTFAFRRIYDYLNKEL